MSDPVTVPHIRGGNVLVFRADVQDVTNDPNADENAVAVSNVVAVVAEPNVEQSGEVESVATGGVIKSRFSNHQNKTGIYMPHMWSSEKRSRMYRHTTDSIIFDNTSFDYIKPNVGDDL